MKKLYIGAIALAAVFSCTREQDNTLVGDEITIEVSMEDALTKTAYADGKYFSWKKGDKIAVQVKNQDGTPHGTVIFTAQKTGAVSTFTGSTQGYSLGEYAFYPADVVKNDGDKCDLEYHYENGENQVQLYTYMTPDNDNPMSAIPLMGKKNEDRSFSFRTATGILKLTLNNLSPDDNSIYIEDSSSYQVPLSGTYTFDDDCTVKMANSTSGAPFKVISFEVEGEEVSKDFYIPVPVGTIPAGMKLVLNYDSENPIAITKEPIEIKRNQVLPLAPVDCLPESQWTNIGKALFHDSYIWGINDKIEYAEVDLYRNVKNSNYYRIDSPYAAVGLKKADRWLYFDASNPSCIKARQYKLGTNLIKGDKTLTSAYMVFGKYNYNFCNVLGTQEDGYPAVIQLGPCYRGSEFSSASNPYDYEIGKDNDPLAIEIVFPGCDKFLDSWESIGKGSFRDSWLWEQAGMKNYGAASVEFYKNKADTCKFAIASPYSYITDSSTGEYSEGLFIMDITDPRAVTFNRFCTGITVTDDDNANVSYTAYLTPVPSSYTPDYSGIASCYVTHSKDGIPYAVFMAPIYQAKDIASYSGSDYYDREIGKDHAGRNIEIYFPGAKAPYSLSGSDIYSSYLASGSFEKLVDGLVGESNNYCLFNDSNMAYDSKYGAYFQIYYESGLSSFDLVYFNRAVSIEGKEDIHAAKVAIYGSEIGEEPWTLLGEYETKEMAASKPGQSIVLPVENKTSYRNFRICILKNTAGEDFTKSAPSSAAREVSFSEIMVFPAK